MAKPETEGLAAGRFGLGCLVWGWSEWRGSAGHVHNNIYFDHVNVDDLNEHDNDNAAPDDDYYPAPDSSRTS